MPEGSEGASNLPLGVGDKQEAVKSATGFQSTFINSESSSFRPTVLRLIE